MLFIKLAEIPIVESYLLRLKLTEGKSLREKIKEKSLTINDAIDQTMRICAGLNEAHEAGIVRRDLKSANIL